MEEKTKNKGNAPLDLHGKYTHFHLLPYFIISKMHSDIRAVKILKYHKQNTIDCKTQLDFRVVVPFI